MTKPFSLGAMLLLSTALIAPAAIAQTAPPEGAPPATATPDSAPPEEQVDISAPGGGAQEGDIVVTGRYIPDAVRATPEVVSVLSSADIARTGEGDIAGALQRVTGLSVVGNGFVYVRGLGDRYSLALLNGSPLPSPEPLRRVVPLDIFPTSVLASALVQKSYSANYPGEFGGGVINLTTKAIPTESFLDIDLGVSGNSESSLNRGYTYDGGDLDFLGFDDGIRDTPNALKARPGRSTFINANGGGISRSEVQAITASLTNAETSLLQLNNDLPLNFSANLSGGVSLPLPDGRIGIIAAAGLDNSWRVRDAVQQTSNDPNLEGIPQRSFRAVVTDNRAIVNGLLGVGAEFGDHKIRWTNLYIRDTLKQARLSAGYDRSVQDQNPNLPDSIISQNSNWFERQLIDTQLVGEFKFDALSVDLRGSYANSQRESPYERSFSYVYDPAVGDYVNNLRSGGQNARISFSDLNEDVYGAGIDLSYRLPTAMPVTLSAGYAYNKTERSSSRRDFQFQPQDQLPDAVAQERPDYLLSDYNVYTYNILLTETSGQTGAAAFDARLRVHAGYGQMEAELVPSVRLTAGVRYEDGVQTVLPIDLFGTGANPVPPTTIKNDYWLPAATVTWNFAPDMQLRLAGSKTIARPQFRELALQLYQDHEADRQFFGNPFLQDSKLTNAEARYEYFFGRDQRLTLAGFYKKIDKPIEAFGFLAGGATLQTSFANAPSADLYGAEVEVQKYIPLDGLSGSFFETRRLVLIGNYTYSKSELKVGANDTVTDPFGAVTAANLFFNDGDPLTGQSDHLVNVQIGLEDKEKLSQQTLMLTYASDRVTNRGPRQGDAQQPDIVERPGIRLDFVARQGVTILGSELEFKAEVRNITGQRYREFQQAGARRIDINRYDIGTSVSFGLGIKL
ncbi:TonB-dependent receptor [Sphingomonas oleivorans]|uniref:TonB-dependent receptor n=1 Tax=Sphingomonas oleivorans TaxID=1735121 RepID=A0A2T5FVN6_9SPHN|nr:TonB-dependent receptor [Sphingomonas oleivorans]PTQ09842.1 TonB-dependent receptor [Sphingomonas oleivorans]